MEENSIIEIQDFSKVDIRVGRIISVEIFPEAKKPALKLKIDFGNEIGIKKSSAQITDLYNPNSIDSLGRPIRFYCFVSNFYYA